MLYCVIDFIANFELIISHFYTLDTFVLLIVPPNSSMVRINMHELTDLLGCNPFPIPPGIHCFIKHEEESL